MRTSKIFVVTTCLCVSTEVLCFISVAIRYLPLYIAHERPAFDLDIEVQLSEGLVE